MRKPVFILMILLSWSTWAVDIGFAPLVIEKKEGDSLESGMYKTRRLIEELGYLDQQDALRMQLYDTAGVLENVVSILDASSFSAYYSCEILIYGRLSYTENYIDGIIKVFDPASGRIIQSLYSRDGAEEEARLLGDLAKKLHNYFTQTLGLAPYRPAREKEYSQWDFQARLGYWSPVNEWRDVLSGVSLFHFEGALTPVYPLLEKGPWLYGLRMGMSLDYRLGLGTPGNERFVYNGVGFGFPVQISGDYRERHRLAVSLTPFILMDILSQQRRHSTQWSGITASGGMSAGFSYMFRIDEVSGVGGNLESSLVFYKPVRVEMSLGLFYEYHLHPSVKGGEKK